MRSPPLMRAIKGEGVICTAMMVVEINAVVLAPGVMMDTVSVA